MLLHLRALTSRTSPDFPVLLAVHEAGHSLAYARLFGRAPQEIKISVASFEGGYVGYDRLQAGRATEALVLTLTTAPLAAKATLKMPRLCQRSKCATLLLAIASVVAT